MMHTENTPKFQYLFHLFQPTDPIRVVEMGCHKTPPSHAFGPAVRPYYLLHLVEKGEGYIERNGIKYVLFAGDAFLIRPDEVTLYCSDEHDPWEYRWIAFDGDFAKTLMEHTTDRLCMKYKKSGLLALQQANNSEILDYLDCLNTLYEVLNSIKTTTFPVETNSISAALQYLENNYFRPVNVAELADRFGFSRAYFSTLFTKCTGETPYNYLTKIRIEKAKRYLEQTRHSVEEIAYSVGFNSLQRFSDAFKRLIGVSPLQYRKSTTD